MQRDDGTQTRAPDGTPDELLGSRECFLEIAGTELLGDSVGQV